MGDVVELSTKELTKAKLQASFLLFVRTFYKLQTGRDFVISNPLGRESHYITIARELKSVVMGELELNGKPCYHLLITVPPRYGKSTLIVYLVAWCTCRWPDANFIYTSYAKSLSKMQTQQIREIINSRYYREIFDLRVSSDSSAKDDFVVESLVTGVTAGGSCFAAGCGGPITGRGAGLQGVDRCGGFIVIDDGHKPEDVSSDTMRQSVIDWYYGTLQSRRNSPTTPIICIAQRLHEDDLPNHLIGTGEWKVVSLPALDASGNALDPAKHTKEQLLHMKDTMPYVYASQYNQDPQPSGGGIFQADWFNVLDIEPHILSSFVCADTAETDKSYNDATSFSFFGVYKCMLGTMDLGIYGLHWIDCVEIRVEPKDLENEFLNFYADCMRHRVKPSVAVIEKKSTGVTLSSSLRKVPGLRVIALDRNAASGSKTQRFLEAQPFVASNRISLPSYGKHTAMCIEHCRKITANNTHRHDDIADTLQTAIQCALIEGSLLPKDTQRDKSIMSDLIGDMNRLNNLRAATR